MVSDTKAEFWKNIDAFRYVVYSLEQFAYPTPQHSKKYSSARSASSKTSSPKEKVRQK
jgi:hypothetical protein